MGLLTRLTGGAKPAAPKSASAGKQPVALIRQPEPSRALVPVAPPALPAVKQPDRSRAPVSAEPAAKPTVNRRNPVDYAYELAHRAEGFLRKAAAKPERGKALSRTLQRAAVLQQEAARLEAELAALGHRREQDYCRAGDCPSHCPYASDQMIQAGFNAMDVYHDNGGK